MKNSLSRLLPGWLRYSLEDEGKELIEQRYEPVRPMSEFHKHLALELSDELHRQRMEYGENFTLTLNSEAAEGIEKILWGLAQENYTFANVRVGQLINGLVNAFPAELDPFNLADEK